MLRGIDVLAVGWKEVLHTIRLDYGKSYFFSGARASEVRCSGVLTRLSTYGTGDPGVRELL